jgi:dolichyl-diphosphooligosaccharide--protein glycosyltransferase
MSATRRALKKLTSFLGKYVNREVLAERVQGARKSMSGVSRGTVIEYIALSLIVIIALAVRIMPIRWGFYLNEFDPYLQWRMAQYVVDHGFLAWFKWHDTMSWYPYGADMPTWNLYGEAFVVAAITLILRAFGVAASVFDVAVIFPVIAGTLTVIAAYFLGKDIWGRGVGMFAALFLALNSSSIGRTQLGFLRHEPLGILLMILIFLFFRRAVQSDNSTRRTLTYASLAGLSMFYLAASWAASYYPLDLIVVYAVVLAVIGRSSKKLLLGYSVMMGIFLLLTPFLVPKLGFDALKDLTWLVVPAGEVVLLARETSSYLPTRKMQVYTLAVAVVATAALVGLLSYFHVIENPAGKFYAVINPFVRGDVPIIQSVAEHQPATWSSFFYEFGTLMFVMLFGFFFVLQRARNDDIFVLLWGVTSVYFAASFVRLTLLMAPAFCILGAIGTVELGKPAVDIIREAVIYPKRKTRVIARIGREFGVAIFLILLIVIVPSFWRAVQTSYQPATIVTSSIPAVPTAGQELHYQDWLEALSWMRYNTPPDSVVFAWWDYGYWITALGNRRSVADNGTQNSTQIGMIAQTFLDNLTMAIPNLQRYNVSYVAIFITPSPGGGQAGQNYQGFGEDGKWYWMARIGNNTMWNNYKVMYQELRSSAQTQSSTYYRVIEDGASNKIVNNETIADNNQLNDKSLLGYMMQQATASGTGTASPYLDQVFASTNHYVFLYQVRYVTETKISLNRLPSSIRYGDSVKLIGNLTTIKGVPLPTTIPVAVDLENSVDNGQTWNTIDTVPVSAGGQFNYTWAPNGGTYLVRSHYLGLATRYVESTSDQQTLSVAGANVTLGLTVSPTTVTVGQNVTFQWTMSPLANGANVTLVYTFDNKTATPIKSFLMTSSSISYSWKVTIRGTFWVRVIFLGSQNYTKALSPSIRINST